MRMAWHSMGMGMGYGRRPPGPKGYLEPNPWASAGLLLQITVLYQTRWWGESVGPSVVIIESGTLGTISSILHG
jgi:hypothetical protein